MTSTIRTALLLTLAACAAPAIETRDASTWIERAAVPLDDEERAYEAFASRLDGVRVVGLGEATHGQHEAFETKRALTMHLVREADVRLVAYEASGSSALAADAYVAGASDDLDAAMRGLGMLVWQVEENAALLRDLRAWNAEHPGERVRFVGIDVQDPSAAARRIGALLGLGHERLARKLDAWSARIEPAIVALWSGDASGYFALAAEIAELDAGVRAAARASGVNDVEVDLRFGELRRALDMHFSAGGRDRAMADMLLAELARLPAHERAVAWAHDAHVTRGPLRYASTTEVGMGGHVAAAIGDAYYALGFAFGEGAFQSVERGADGRFGFRRHAMSAPPAGSLDAELAAARDGDWIVDLRGAPRSGPTAEWLARDHRRRWYGGYGVPDDVDARSRDLASLQVANLREDFDGLVFLARTTAARPRDPSRVLLPSR